MHKIKSFVFAHKILSSIVTLIIIGGAYYIISALSTDNSGQTTYVVSTVQKDTIMTTVSGSGQVSASNQVELSAKASGDITYIGVTSGQEVKAGALVAQIDAKDALKSIRDAEANLQSAKISYEKLIQPADNLTIVQAENSLAKAIEAKQDAQDALIKAYEDGFNTISNAFLSLPNVVSGIQDVLFTSTVAPSGGVWNIDHYANSISQYNDLINTYKNNLNQEVQTVRITYDNNFAKYKEIGRYSSTSTIESLLNQTYDTTKIISETVKNTNNYIQLYKDELTKRLLKPSTTADTHLSTLNSYTGTTNSHLLNLLSAKNTIKQDKDAIIDAERTIAEKTESLADIKNGADALDIESAKLSLQQKENSLLDAKEKLSDYYIRAPFDGAIAQINVEKGGTISSGGSVATLITKKQIAEITLNEVDVAKVKVGQKSNLTFDAVEGLNITGEVAQVDSLGSVSQGVVTYVAKIKFDLQDERIKPGMSVSATITTEVKQDVLVVSNNAIKTEGEIQYVQIPTEEISDDKLSSALTLTKPLSTKIVETGLSNDTLTEITSGLNEGDKIISKTITKSSQTTTTASTKSILGGGGGMGMPR